MENRIVVPLGSCYNIIAEKGADSNYNEIFIWLEDKNGVCVQDIAIIGQKYHYDENLNVVQDVGILARLFTDSNNDDYTHQFSIDI